MSEQIKTEEEWSSEGMILLFRAILRKMFECATGDIGSPLVRRADEKRTRFDKRIAKHLKVKDEINTCREFLLHKEYNFVSLVNAAGLDPDTVWAAAKKMAENGWKASDNPIPEYKPYAKKNSYPQEYPRLPTEDNVI